MSKKSNLILPLLALSLYCHCNNVNLANNTTMTVIIIAILFQQREITQVEDEVTDAPDFQNNNGTGTCPCQTNHQAYPSQPYAQPYFAQPYPTPFSQTAGTCGCAQPNYVPWSPYATNCAPYHTNSGCHCNTVVY